MNLLCALRWILIGWPSSFVTHQYTFALVHQRPAVLVSSRNKTRLSEPMTLLSSSFLGKTGIRYSV